MTDEINRVNWDEMEDVGVVTHYQGKPFTGIAYYIHENGEIKEEYQMLTGIKHGKAFKYSDEGDLVWNIIYKNDIIEDYGDETWLLITNLLFQKDEYEYDIILYYIGVVKEMYKQDGPDWPDIFWDKFNERVLEKLISSNKVKLPEKLVQEIRKKVEEDELRDAINNYYEVIEEDE